MKQTARLVLLLTILGQVCAQQENEKRPIFDWPLEFTGEDGGTVVLYQPQLTSWEDWENLEGRAAVALTLAEDQDPILGALTIRAKTHTNLEDRMVVLYDVSVEQARFPSLDSQNAALQKVETAVRRFFSAEIDVELDRLLVAVERDQARVKEPELNNSPPQVFVATKRAILVMTEGEPVFVPIEKTSLEYVANTNWDLFRIKEKNKETFYLRDDNAWLESPRLEAGWGAVKKLPKAFNKLPKDDADWAEVRKNVPGIELKPFQIPRVFVTDRPAELIQVDGDPQLKEVEGTSLFWVTNTDADLFLDGRTSTYYMVVSGRWFRNADLATEGWEFATPSLPEDFQRIPEDHERAAVRSLVPGTPEADEAVLLAHIPQKASVERDTVKAPTVTYAGEPEFQTIKGTSIERAVNSESDVIKVKTSYYLCHQAVWFVSDQPTGPWEVADTVPEEVYQIPPESPVHHVTHVRVYASSPTYVTFGYTSGYYGMYFGYGTMFWGTGFYYPPYFYYGPLYPYPVYYRYPYTYGAYAYYNPATGTYGRGARVYGPYGGVGRGARYNAATGTYARGVSAWGPYSYRGFAEAYNPRTGTYAQTRQGGNIYQRWGTTGVRRGDDWVRTARYRDSEKAAAAYRTSEGGRGFVGKGNDNIYAGRDGNVYRRNADGWQKYEDGNWSSVDRSAANQQGIASLDRSRMNTARAQAEARGGASNRDFNTLQQLDRDALRRAQGADRTQRYQNWNRGAAGHRGRRR